MSSPRKTLAAAIILAAVTGCSTSTTGGAPTTVPLAEMTVTGVMTLNQNIGGVSGHSLTDRTAHNSAVFVESGACAGQVGFSDLRYGTAVAIYDDKGAIVGSGATAAGHIVGNANRAGYIANITGCAFPWSIDHVPAGAPFYQVEVSHRGRLTYTAAQMAAPLLSTLNN